MQKLIILGGNPETKQLVEYANNLGIFTIVIDPNPNSAAKKIATKSYDIDGFDVKNIVEVARQEKVQGVLVGVADILVKPYYEICHELHLPCYATKGAIQYLTSKAMFNQLCNSYSIDTIPTFTYDEAKRENFHQFPVVIKPVDSGAGVGIEICSKKEDFDALYKKALNASKRKAVLIEKYMNCDDMFAHYTIQNNRIYLSVVGDRITKQITKNSPPVCIMAKYPSKYIHEYKDRVDEKIKELIHGLKIENGLLNIQFFKEKDRFFAYDPGFRLQGEGMHFYLKEVCGFDHRKMLIHFALTGKFGEHSIEKLNDPFLKGKKAYTIWLLLKSGKIDKIEGMEDIQKENGIIKVVQRFYEGDEVKKEFLGTERQVFSRIYIVVDSQKEALKIIQTIKDKIHVYDENEKEMIMDFYDTYAKEIANE